MSTTSTTQLDTLANVWQDSCGYSSAVCSGIVGDLAHKERGGYHISIMDQPSTNYSVIKVDDKAPPGSWPRDKASAIDMNLALSDMKTCHARLKVVFANRATDPRAKYINAWNGWDGTGSPGRYNMVTGTIEVASIDHEWHVHLEVRRRYVNDPEMVRAIISIMRGETVAEYLGGDMDWTDKPWSATALRPISVADALQSTYNNTANVPALITAFNTFTTTEAARDAQDAARDAALSATLTQVLGLLQAGTGGGGMTAEQFAQFEAFVGQKIAEAGEDAIHGVQRRLDAVAEALDNAGTALSAADDPLAIES